MKTRTFILVATYRVGMYPSVCVEAVEKLGKRMPLSVCLHAGVSLISSTLANSFSNSSDELPNPENLGN